MNARNKFFVLLGVLLIASATYYFATTTHSSDYVLIGTVDANQIVVSPKIEGRIVKLNVTDGSEVKAGDLIAVLDSDELRAEQAAAAASLAGAQQQIGQTVASYQQSRGATESTVAQMQAMLANSQALLEEAKANLVKSQQDYERTVSLAQQGVASKQDADHAAADLNAQKAHVDALQKSVNAAQANLAVARAQTYQANAAQKTVAVSRAQVQNAKAMLEQSQARVGYTNILAPVSGTVSTRVAREGEVVNIGSPIVTLVDLGDTWVYASVPETFAVNIAIGDSLRVRLPNGQMIEGNVTYKAPEADFATQRDVGRTKRDIKTVSIKVAINNVKHTLVPGMTAEVLIPAAMQRQGRS